MKKKASLFVAACLALIVGYYSVKIFIANKETPAIKAEFLAESKITLQYNEMSPRQQEIFIKVQDPNFWNHNGVEFSTPGSGWTTVTQSIAKWFYFHPFKQGIGKIKQTLLARFVLNSHLTKEEQLLVFINHVWFAENVKGFRNAANHFYHKDISELSEDEFISLMAMPVSPRKYNIVSNPKNNRDRSDRIKKMLSGEYEPKGLFDIYYDK